MTEHDDGAWAPLCNVHTTIEELEQIIATQTQRTIEAFREQLQSDPELAFITERGRVYAIAKVTPLIEQETRDALTSGWLRLQAEQAYLEAER